jgi:hypothetical protein
MECDLSEVLAGNDVVGAVAHLLNNLEDYLNEMSIWNQADG